MTDAASAGSAPPRVLVVGESLVDVVERDGARNAHAGGSPLNVAYGLARLGVPTAFATEFADDDHGRIIEAHLDSAGVEILRHRSSERTSVATARIGSDGAAEYTFSLQWEFDAADLAVDLPPAPVVHVGSVGAFLEPGSQAVRRVLQELPATSLVSFDPNVRPALIPDRALARDLVAWYAGRADLVKLSDEDAAWLFPLTGEDDVLEWILAQGASVVVLTRGSAGSLLRTRWAQVELPAVRTEVVDTIGAGDAYMAGLIAAVIDPAGGVDVLRAGADSAFLERLGRIASTTAALTVARAGAAPPTRAELEAALDLAALGG